MHGNCMWAKPKIFVAVAYAFGMFFAPWCAFCVISKCNVGRGDSVNVWLFCAVCFLKETEWLCVF